MENNIQLFKHPEFGKVRVVTIDGEPWFVATDVCRILELKNVSDTMNRLDDDERRNTFIPAMGIGSTDTHGGQEMLVVNEPGLYRLVFASRKKEAREFQRWVYHEVLPSIRKTGSYSLKKNDRDPLAVERDRLAVERDRLAVERDRLAVERDRLAVERDRLAVERERFALGQEKFNFDNSEDGKIFTAVDMLIKLATLAGERTSIRLKLVGLATNLLVRDNFIDASDIIFKK